MMKITGRLSWTGAAVLVLLSMLLACAPASAISFPLATGKKRCFAEEVPSGVDFTVSYVYDKSYATFLDVILTDVNGAEVFSDVGRMEATHTHHVASGGDFLLCFSTRQAGKASDKKKMDVPVVSFFFKVGTEGIDYKNLATKEKLKPMEIQLRMMEDAVHAIHNEYVYYKDKEAEMRSTNEHMTAKVVWMAVLVILIFIAFSFLQLRHLKSYFRKKRMID